MTNLSGAIWRKASASVHNGGCVEVAVNLPGVTAVRDSKRPQAGALLIDRPAFAAFIADIRRGRYDTAPSCPSADTLPGYSPRQNSMIPNDLRPMRL
jgi:hypothetical protein